MADIKFSELQKATTSKDSDEIAILQDGVNKMIASPILESKIINKTVTRVIEQGGASLNLINLKGIVPTYADLATITPTPELNDAYQVEVDGLVYVYTENGFQADGEGIKVQPEPIGVVEEDNPNAVSGGEVYEAIKYKQPYTTNNILPNIRLINGYYIDHSNGNLIASGAFTVTDYIELNDNLIYEILRKESNLFFAFYNESKEFISNLSNYSIDGILTFYKTNAKFLRVSFLTSELNNTKILISNYSDNVVDSIHKLYTNLLTDYTVGYYVNQANGGILQASGFNATKFIRVNKGCKYKISEGYNQYAFYDMNFKYISDNQSANGYREVTALNDGYIRLTFTDGDLNNAFFKQISSVYPIILDRNIVSVRKVGGDFNSITDAYNYANTRSSRQYIEIDNGEWEENLEFLTGSGHNFIGDSKQGCIIFNQGAGGDILKVKAGFNFENITFDQRNGGYAVHPDYGGEGLIEFLNCKFLTTFGSAIGAGSADGQTLRINRCEIHQIGEYNPTGVLYWHNSVYVDNNSKQQRLEVLFSEIYSANGTPPLRIDDANKIYGDGVGNNASIMFAHNTLYSVGVTPNNNDHNIDLRGHYDVPIVGNIVGCIKVDPQSTGNNLSKLNY